MKFLRVIPIARDFHGVLFCGKMINNCTIGSYVSPLVQIYRNEKYTFASCYFSTRDCFAILKRRDSCTNACACVALTSKRRYENFVVLKVKIRVELDARWIYLIYNNARATKYVEFRWKLLPAATQAAWIALNATGILLNIKFTVQKSETPTLSIASSVYRNLVRTSARRIYIYLTYVHTYNLEIRRLEDILLVVCRLVEFTCHVCRTQVIKLRPKDVWNALCHSVQASSRRCQPRINQHKTTYERFLVPVFSETCSCERFTLSSN